MSVRNAPRTGWTGRALRQGPAGLCRALGLTLALVTSGLTAGSVFAQDAAPQGEAAPAGKPADKPAADLSQTQQQIQRDFERFEKSLYDVAEYSRRTDPEQAELLYRARSQSQEQRILDEMRQLSEVLRPKDGKIVIGDSVERQDALIARMEALLKVLQSADERDRVQREIERIQDLLKDTNQVIGKQRDIRADTNRGGETKRLTEREKQVAEEARKLADKIDKQDAERQGEATGKKPDGKPADGKSDDNKPADGQPKGDKPGESPDGKSPADPKDGSKDGQEGAPKDGSPDSDQKPMDGSKPMEGDKPTDGQKPSDGQKPADGQKPSDGSPMPGQSPMGQSPMGPSPMGEPQQGQPQQGQPQEGAPSQGGEPEAAPQEQDRQTPGREQLEQARKEMQRAIEELEKQQREGASEAQQQALAQLEQLKARLEAILRQLHEEENELLLASLEARFQKLRKAQMAVNAETVRLDKIPTDEAGSRRLDRGVALSRDEREIIVDTDKALALLRDEGSSVAFPEAVEQMRENMVVVAERLAQADAGSTTRVIEELIIDTLDEMILALQQEMEKNKEKKQNQKGRPQQQGEQERGLVNQLAELKMIRSLQTQINKLTRQIGSELQGEQINDPALRKLSDDLARRQKRLQDATYDLATGKTR